MATENQLPNLTEIIDLPTCLIDPDRCFIDSKFSNRNNELLNAKVKPGIGIRGYLKSFKGDISTNCYSNEWGEADESLKSDDRIPIVSQVLILPGSSVAKYLYSQSQCVEIDSACFVEKQFLPNGFETNNSKENWFYSENIIKNGQIFTIKSDVAASNKFQIFGSKSECRAARLPNLCHSEEYIAFIRSNYDEFQKANYSATKIDFLRSLENQDRFFDEIDLDDNGNFVSGIIKPRYVIPAYLQAYKETLCSESSYEDEDNRAPVCVNVLIPGNTRINRNGDHLMAEHAFVHEQILDSGIETDNAIYGDIKLQQYMKLKFENQTFPLFVSDYECRSQCLSSE